MLDAARLSEISAACAQAPCIESLGLSAIDADAGSCRLRARHDPRFNGLLPGFHGGMLAMVADCAAWFAIVTQTGPTEPLVTTDMQMRYLAPCLGDVTVAARVIKLGKTLCPVAFEMFDPAGVLVACGQVTYMRLSSLGAARAGSDVRAGGAP